MWLPGDDRLHCWRLMFCETLCTLFVVLLCANCPRQNNRRLNGEEEQSGKWEKLGGRKKNRLISTVDADNWHFFSTLIPDSHSQEQRRRDFGVKCQTGTLRAAAVTVRMWFSVLQSQALVVHRGERCPVVRTWPILGRKRRALSWQFEKQSKVNIDKCKICFRIFFLTSSTFTGLVSERAPFCFNVLRLLSVKFPKLQSSNCCPGWTL